MILTAVVRIVGVAVAFYGAVYLAPYAFGHYAALAGRRARHVAAVARRWLRLRRDATITAPHAHVGVGTGRSTVTAHGSGRAWHPDAPLPQQVEQLREWVDDLYRSVAAVRAELGERIDQAAERQDVALARLRDDLRQLAQRVDDERKAERRLNVEGLPPVAVGIVLGGWPDRYMWTWLAAVLLAAAAAAVWRSAWQWRKRQPRS